MSLMLDKITWVLKPIMVYWPIRTVVKNMITYVSFVWWPKIKQATTINKISMVQRLTCQGIAGTMSTRQQQDWRYV